MEQEATERLAKGAIVVNNPAAEEAAAATAAQKAAPPAQLLHRLLTGVEQKLNHFDMAKLGSCVESSLARTVPLLQELLFLLASCFVRCLYQQFDAFQRISTGPCMECCIVVIVGIGPADVDRPGVYHRPNQVDIVGEDRLGQLPALFFGHCTAYAVAPALSQFSVVVVVLSHLLVHVN